MGSFIWRGIYTYSITNRPHLSLQHRCHPINQSKNPIPLSITTAYQIKSPNIHAIPAAEIDKTFTGTTINLASSALQARLVDISDEFFASAQNLLNPRPPISKPGTFVATGAWYDGWETRRHNTEEYDYVIVRLGVPDAWIHGVEIDTAFFNGNHAPLVSVEGIWLTGEIADQVVKRGARQEASTEFHWTTLLAKTEVGPSARHAWVVPEDRRGDCFTHVRLRMYPDGGIARFRVYGIPRPSWPVDEGQEVELSAAKIGGIVVACSDQHYSKGDNLLLPGRGVDMGDGWETKRSRQPNHVDWVVVKLGDVGHVQRVVVDTMHFRGNFPRAIRVEGMLAEGENSGETDRWEILVRDRKMKADEEADCQIVQEAKGMRCSHVKLTIIPDGGVKRLRIFGTRK